MTDLAANSRGRNDSSIGSVGSQPSDQVPHGILLAIGSVLLFTMAVAFIARTTDIGATRLVPAPAEFSRDLTFITDPDGAMTIRDVDSGRELNRLPANRDGFIKIVLRSITQYRATKSVPDDVPLRLSRLTDGKTILHDAATDRTIIVSAFGPANTVVFSRLLDEQRD